MIFGKYKNKAAEGDVIFLVKDDSSGKWFANNISKRIYSDFFDTLDNLRNALRLKNTSWYNLHEHISRLVEVHNA